MSNATLNDADRQLAYIKQNWHHLSIVDQYRLLLMVWKFNLENKIARLFSSARETLCNLKARF